MKKNPDNPVNPVYFLLALCIFVCGLSCPKAFSQGALPSALWNNVSDYTFMYYPKPLTDGTEFHIQTNHHFLAFDYNNLHLNDLRLITQPRSEQEAVRKDLDFLPIVDQNLLECVLTFQGKDYKLLGGCTKPNECQLIESGKYFQRRNLTNLQFEDGAPELEASLEICSWPDRIAIILKVSSETAISTQLKMKMMLPEAYRSKIFSDEQKLLSVDDSGNGFLLYTPFDNTGSRVGNQFTASKDFSQATEYQVELIAIPVKGYAGEDIRTLIKDESNPVTITSTQILPGNKALATQFDPVYGWHNVQLNNDISGNYGMERIRLNLNNSSSVDQTVRLNFSKSKVNGITGISAIIRDLDENPTGIPVQLSKNWHNEEGEYKGPWFHGFSMLTIPANSDVTLELILVNAFWGKLPAASHAQLCLVGWTGGWGDNQLWDQSAIGAFGESICYEPDGGQAQTMVCDVRPLMVQSVNENVTRPKQWGWTPNVGGADFFRFYNENGVKQFITRIKTQYKRYCPNLTEVTYAGTTSGNEADYELTTSIYRSDDYVRGVYKIKLKVNEAIDFSRLAIIQVGSESYSYTGEKKFAFGDENGLIEEWDTQWGEGIYRKASLNTNGRFPWVSMHEADNKQPDSWGTWANRGIVVRDWKARLGGHETKPYFSEYGTKASRGGNTSLVEINPPIGVTQLQPGDYVEAEITQVIFPQDADSYYGPNLMFKEELEANANTWKPVLREAAENNLNITASKGTVVHQFPIVVEVDDNNEAIIDIGGGVGFVPVTFTGLTSYKDFSLKVMKDGKEVYLNQEVHGNDYWQTDYDPVSKTWEVTYSVPLDDRFEYFTAPDFRQTMLYNDFDESQNVSWSNPSILSFTDNEANPESSSINNPSQKVGKVVRGNGVHANVRFVLPETLDLSEKSEFKLKVYFDSDGEEVPDVANFRLILRENGAGATQYAVTKNIEATNQWVEYTINCSGANGRADYNEVWLFFASPDLNNVAAGYTYYIDDLEGPPINLSTANVQLHIPTTCERLKIFPNPANDSITLNLESENTVIYDAKGSEICCYPTNLKQLDVSSLRQGIYLVKALRRNGEVKSGFFVKN